MRLSEIAAHLGCEVRGDGDVEIRGVHALDEAGPGDLTFLANPKYAAQAAATRAAAIILTPDAPDAAIPSLRAPNPYLAFARALALFHAPRRPPAGIHATAVVAPSARIAEPTSIGAHAVIGDDVVIGPNAVIHPHVTIYPGVRIGADFTAHAGVVVREEVTIGDRVVLQPGVVLGGDGFGFVPRPGAVPEKIPQTGTVAIEDDVEIGALTTVDRATVGSTTVRSGVKLDNLVMVGHNSEIGERSLLAAQVGLAGSTRIGRDVRLGGQVGVAGHLTIGDGAQVVAQSGVPSSVDAGHVVGGYPAIEVTRWRRISAALLKLPALLRRVRRLEKQVGIESGDE